MKVLCIKYKIMQSLHRVWPEIGFYLHDFPILFNLGLQILLSEVMFTDTDLKLEILLNCFKTSC